MNYSLYRTAEPDSEPVTLSEARLFLRVDGIDDNDTITSLISLARETVEDKTGVVFLESGWKYVADSWPECRQTQFGHYGSRPVIPLMRFPLIGVQEVSYVPCGAEAPVVLDPSQYSVVSATRPGSVLLIDEIPSLARRPDAVQVTFTAGHEDANLIPSRALQAVRLLIANWYELRSPVVVGTISSELPFSVRHLLNSIRLSGFVG